MVAMNERIKPRSADWLPANWGDYMNAPMACQYGHGRMRKESAAPLAFIVPW
jgi:hypothetical protein